MDNQQSEIEYLREIIKTLVADVEALHMEVEELRSTAFWANLNVKWAEAFVRPILDERKNMENNDKQRLVDAYFESGPDA